MFLVVPELDFDFIFLLFIYFFSGLAAGFSLQERPSGSASCQWFTLEGSWGGKSANGRLPCVSTASVFMFVCFGVARFVQQSRSLAKLLPGNSGVCDLVQAYSWRESNCSKFWVQEHKTCFGLTSPPSAAWWSHMWFYSVVSQTVNIL